MIDERTQEITSKSNKTITRSLDDVEEPAQYETEQVAPTLHYVEGPKEAQDDAVATEVKPPHTNRAIFAFFGNRVRSHHFGGTASHAMPERCE